MRRTAFVLWLGACVLAGTVGSGLLLWRAWQNTRQLQVANPIHKLAAGKEVGESEVWGKARQWWQLRRANPETGMLSLSEFLQYRQAVEARMQVVRNAAQFTWRNIGPINRGGRIRALWVDVCNPNRLYAGAASGGLWLSEDLGETWRLVKGIDNYNISAITQDPNTCKIYVGTGEYFAATDQFNSLAFTLNSGLPGKGIYVSVTPDSFTHLPSTTPTPNTFSHRWAFVNALAWGGGKLFAATYNGLVISTDGGQTWTSTSGLLGNATVVDVEVLDDGLTILAATGQRVFRSTDGGATFTEITGTIGLGGSRSRIAFASSGQTVYMVVVDGHSIGFLGGLHSIWRSTDGGVSWELIGAGSMGGTTSNPYLELCCYVSIDDPTQRMHCQGFYDIMIGASPHDPDLLFVGGIVMSRWTPDRGWHSPAGFPPFGIHVDFHAIAFHPTNPDLIWIGNDGGVYRSEDRGLTFRETNKGLVTTQFYAFAVHRTLGTPAGGTQDNGTWFIPFLALTPYYGYHILGGDGGYAFFSVTREALAASFLGCFAKSALSQITPFSMGVSSLFDQVTDPDGDLCPGTGTESQFVHPLRIWEDTDTSYRDVMYKVTFRLNDTLPGDRVLVRDTYDLAPPYDSLVFLVLDSLVLPGPRHIAVLVTMDSVFVSNTVMETGISPQWFVLQSGGYYITDIDYSADGDCAFLLAVGSGFSTSRLIRICGLRTARLGNIYNCYFEDLASCPSNDNNCLDNYVCSFDAAAAGITVSVVRTFNRVMVGLAPDPLNPNRLVVTGGGYGGTEAHVFQSLDIKAPSPTFTPIDGDLPEMPVFDAIAYPGAPDTVLVGTEYGVWVTTNATAGSPTWQPATQGLGTPPVVMMEVIPKPPNGSWSSGQYTIYLATHGRGFFAWNLPVEDLITGINAPIPVASNNNVPQQTIRIVPNPAYGVRQVLILFPPIGEPSQSDVRIGIYDLQGRVVMPWQTVRPQTNMAGLWSTTLDVSSLDAGMYIVLVQVRGQTLSGILMR